MTIEKKSWYQSKTKWAALFIGMAPILSVIGGMLNGSIDVTTGISQLAAGAGGILGVFGIRDLPFINKK